MNWAETDFMTHATRSPLCFIWDKPRSGCAAARAGAPRKRAPPCPPVSSTTAPLIAPLESINGRNQCIDLKADLLKSRNDRIKGFEDARCFQPGIDQMTRAAKVNQPSIRVTNNQKGRQKASIEKRFSLGKSCFHGFIVTFHVKRRNKNQNTQQASDPWTRARHGQPSCPHPGGVDSPNGFDGSPPLPDTDAPPVDSKLTTVGLALPG
jgi:hypothetical protein